MNIFRSFLNYFETRNKYALEWFFDAAFVGIAINKGGSFIYGNDSFIAMFGYSQNDMVKMIKNLFLKI